MSKKLDMAMEAELSVLKQIIGDQNQGDITPRLSKVLTTPEIEKLYQMVNTDRDWKIDVASHQLVDKIIELWFESQGYDFWDNPFPEVVEWTLHNDKSIEFVYISNK